MMSDVPVGVTHPLHISTLAKARRLQLGMSQKDLAVAAGVHFNWIIRFEKGRENLQVSRVLRTLVALNIPVALDPRAEAPDWTFGIVRKRISRGKDGASGRTKARKRRRPTATYDDILYRRF